MPATRVIVVDPGDGSKAIRHLDPECPELGLAGDARLLGEMGATQTVRTLTVRCRRCFAETEAREARERERPQRRAGPGARFPAIGDTAAPTPPDPAVRAAADSAGHLETAPILFVSSNPSISGSVHSQRPAELEREPPSEYLGRWATEHPSIRRLGQGPRWEWADEEIVDRYESAFDLYIADGVAGRLPDGGRAPATRFWVEVRSRARELIPGREMRPGVDYALTEAVRCKSRGEHGVAEAVGTCSARYLRRTLELSGAVVVVVLGRVAAGAVEQQLGVSRSRPVHERVLVGGRPRWVAFLPHPNARTTRTFAANLGEEVLGRMQRAVAEVL